jgi:DnaJ homolog subfamily C member 9
VVQITDEKLDDYYNSFRGSTSEASELLELYERFDGNMKSVVEYLPCSNPDLDSHRFMDSIDAAIKEGKVTSHPSYVKWRRKVEKKKRPENPLRKVKTNPGPSADLVAAIRKRVRITFQASCAVLV